MPRSAFLASVLVCLGAVGCAAAGPPAAEAEPRIGDRALCVAEILDPSGALTPAERARLRGSVRDALQELARLDEKSHRKPALTIVEGPTTGTATAVFSVEVSRFDPEGSTLEALTVGFGAGRPGWEIRCAVTTDDLKLDRRREIQKASNRYVDAPGSRRERMLRDLADAAVAFVRRRR